MNWSNIHIGHVKPTSSFDINLDENLGEAFCWKNTQPLIKEIHHQKGTKYSFLDYQLQYVQAYQF